LCVLRKSGDAKKKYSRQNEITFTDSFPADKVHTPAAQRDGCKKKFHKKKAAAAPAQKIDAASLKLFSNFCGEHLLSEIDGPFEQHGRYLFAVPEGMPGLSGIRVARSGWHLGEIKKDRFEPSHALALGLAASDVIASHNLSAGDCERYLRGESLAQDLPFADKAWVLLCFSGFPLGWARRVGSRLKNKYPQGWM
jgi:NOL1/NOP2/fmu family ribosome biogenesis protein